MNDSRHLSADFGKYLPDFKKIIPVDYGNMLAAIAQFTEKGLSPEEAELDAFYAVTGQKGGN